ncbi:hypothetical protein BDV95DRAFT_601706 [Massariosphaeria phaeospora]|uniref:RSE1/DDB1/CPSF1 C-terminal domain-containing protein n=1 Tax=Massariosphaeria phaeospora TaxID=100035 RepID=A0A7C8IE19_9PLEO|nr:hypothetical protein BDV95DRAFT_601706 [Massariosphaeria phaeospora]
MRIVSAKVVVGMVHQAPDGSTGQQLKDDCERHLPEPRSSGLESLPGRNHLAFRSYYTPSKCVIDGDLCERFLVFGRDKRESIAGQLAGGWTSDMIDDAIWLRRASFS